MPFVNFLNCPPLDNCFLPLALLVRFSLCIFNTKYHKWNLLIYESLMLSSRKKTLLLSTSSFSVSWGWLLFLFVLGNTSLFVLPYSKILCLNPYSYVLHVMVEKENSFTLLFLRSTSNFRRNSQGSLWGFQVEWDWVLLYIAIDFWLITYMYWEKKE